MIDYTVNLSDILQLFGLVAAIVFFAQSIVARLKSVEKELNSLSGVVTKLAVQETRLNIIDARLGRHSEMLDDLRHGRGFIDDQK